MFVAVVKTTGSEPGGLQCMNSQSAAAYLVFPLVPQ